MNYINVTAFFGALILDRIAKIVALVYLSDHPISVCYGLNWILSWNKGISWGLFNNNSSLFAAVLTGCIMLTIALFGYYIWQRLKHNLPVALEMIVLGGAVSNLVDRFVYGSVIDFIQLYVGSFSWPIFNIADSCIVIGIAGILLRSWRRPNE